MAFKKDNKIKSNFSQIRISLASPEEILENSSGEVLKPETVNYRTYKPERDGLFCERIFGPVKDFECHCGKYKRIRYRGIVCDRCGVEVTEKKVRRERMGHIKLEVPVAHVWYFRTLPNKMAYLLGMSAKKLESIIYYERYVLIQPGVLAARINDELTHESAAKSLEKDPNPVFSEDQYEQYLDYLDAEYPGNDQLEDSDPDKFICKTGAEAIYDMLLRLDLDSLSYELRHRASTDGSQQRKNEALKRLQVVESFRASKHINRPEWMIMKVLPVIPPDLRPLVPLDGGRFATSDLNDLYRRVIIRNNRLKRMIEIKAPEVILRNEKRMLQEAVDSLFDNSRKSSAVRSDNNRPLKSLSDSLKGKQGRFRQNLLGKRVDYSARSVIVVGPELKMHECGLPKYMAAELYKPFVIRKLIERGIVKTVKSAKKIVDRKDPVVWDILEHVMKGHPVLLNRAPTLHRLGIQAFQPKMIEGKAIQLHPLSCTAFNADFDGDQMAVHLPLSAEAQAEARVLMLSTNNILKPADGRPVTVPSHEMIIGMYWLTMLQEEEKGAGRAFSSVAEAIMAHDRGDLHVGAPIKLRLEGVIPPVGYADKVRADGSVILETSLGRALFNEALPSDFPFVNERVGKKQIGQIVNDLAERYPLIDTVRTLDGLKDLGFQWGSRSGVTVSIADVQTPPSKPEILAAYDARAAKIDTLYERGSVTEDERRQELIELWTDATAELTDAMKDNFSQTNPIFVMVNSGARGNMTQMRQIAAMRGLVANPKGDIIARPIKSNFREGLSVLEYFISTHGGRKGQADTALRTADSGYLTRRLVDVSQDVIIREEDCQTERGLVKTIARWTKIVTDEDGRKTQIAAEPLEEGASVSIVPDVETAVYARTAATDITDSQGNVLVVAGTDLGDAEIERLASVGVTQVKVRSVLTCEAATGTCAMCYGRSLASGKTVDVGEAVGIVAAQSIGEPGTQLTMRTFHTGGVAGDDITQGLPRVVELFEARQPKGKAPIAEADGVIRIEDGDRSRKIIIVRDDGGDDLEYPVARRTRLEFEDANGARVAIRDGVHVSIGQQLTAGQVDPQDVLRVRGLRKVQEHLVEEVQRVYRTQGAPIHDKHIEIIIRQMLRRVTVIDSGDTSMMPGELVDRQVYEAANRKALTEGGRPAEGRPVLMGITKASLATDSWLSAASFQETTKVLTDAAIQGKSDTLVGLKENVILGKLIPAGTGLERYRNIRVEPTADAKSQAYTVSYDPYDYSFGSDLDVPGVPLDDIDFGDIR